MASTTVRRSPNVLILGAGLGGLLLAQALRKQDIPFQIFERDESLHGRSQGWAIALHTILQDIIDSVSEDMPSIEVTNHLLPLELPAQICFNNGVRRVSIQSTADARIIRANRSRLRDWLATKIDVHWDKHVKDIQEDADSVKLVFSDGTSATGDVLVGADGVHSFVRNHLFDGQELLHDVPQGVIIGETVINKEQFHRQLQLAHSAYVVLGKDFHTFVGLNAVEGDGSGAKYYWFLAWTDPKAAQGSHFWTVSASKQELYDYTMERCQSMDPKFTDIMHLTNPDGILTPPLIMRDMVLKEMPNRRITLLGDAAHPMTPFRGEGGCQAMQDAMNLAQTLAQAHPANVQEVLKGYQDEMLARGSEAVKNSRAAFEGANHGPTQAWGQPVKQSND